MAKILGEMRSLKSLAKSQSMQGHDEIAAKTLDDGIDVLKAALTSHGDSSQQASVPLDADERLIASELADMHGMVGGVRRRQGELVRAIAAYDQGFQYESNPRYRLVTTYNALNRLVTRILMCPGSLSDSDALRSVNELEFVDVPRALNELRTQLKQQVDSVRANDFWAAGDLAFTCALVGDDQGALDATQRFGSFAPPPTTDDYTTYIDCIGAVAQLDTPRTDALNKLKVLIESKMKQTDRHSLLH